MAIIARAGRLIVVGLEEKNIERLKAGNPFHQSLEDKLGIPYDITIYYGETWAEIANIAEKLSGPDTHMIDLRNRRKQ